MLERPLLTVSAVVAAFEIERRTLQRMLADNQLPAATKDSRGRWLVPVESLHAAAISARKTWVSGNDKRDSGTTSGEHEVDSGAKPHTGKGFNGATDKATRRDSDATDLRRQVALLQTQLEAERRLREAAEQNSSDLRRAMLMIEAAQPLPPATNASEVPVRRRWWKLGY